MMNHHRRRLVCRQKKQRATYLTLGYNDCHSPRTELHQKKPEEFDPIHDVACIRCDSKNVLGAILFMYCSAGEFSLPKIYKFLQHLPTQKIRTGDRIVFFQDYFRDQYEVLWQRTSTAEEV